MESEKSNDRETSRKTQLMRYAEAILRGAAEEGADRILLVPENEDVGVYLDWDNGTRNRLLSIPISSFADLWRYAIAPGFETGQHVLKVGDSNFLFKLKERRLALGETVSIEIMEMKPEDLHPLSDEAQTVYTEESWEKVRTILDSILNLGLDRESERIEMSPGDPDVNILYFHKGIGRWRLTISQQTYRQIVHYMREFYFFFGFAARELGGKHYIIKPVLLETGNEPKVILDIEEVDEDTDDDRLDDADDLPEL